MVDVCAAYESFCGVFLGGVRCVRLSIVVFGNVLILGERVCVLCRLVWIWTFVWED